MGLLDRLKKDEKVSPEKKETRVLDPKLVEKRAARGVRHVKYQTEPNFIADPGDDEPDTQEVARARQAIQDAQTDPGASWKKTPEQSRNIFSPPSGTKE